MMLEDERIPITWDLFKEKFFGEYFSVCQGSGIPLVVAGRNVCV